MTANPRILRWSHGLLLLFYMHAHAHITIGPPREILALAPMPSSHEVQVRRDGGEDQAEDGQGAPE